MKLWSFEDVLDGIFAPFPKNCYQNENRQGSKNILHVVRKIIYLAGITVLSQVKAVFLVFFSCTLQLGPYNYISRYLVFGPILTRFLCTLLMLQNLFNTTQKLKKVNMSNSHLAHGEAIIFYNKKKFRNLCPLYFFKRQHNK